MLTAASDIKSQDMSYLEDSFETVSYSEFIKTQPVVLTFLPFWSLSQTYLYRKKLVPVLPVLDTEQPGTSFCASSIQFWVTAQNYPLPFSCFMMGWAPPIHFVVSLAYNNVGVFFYVVKNLPNIVNSCFANVHLLALCYAVDWKAMGMRMSWIDLSWRWLGWALTVLMGISPS